MSGREDRRRRVLRDDTQGASSQAAARKTKTDGERYTDQAKHEQLPRLIDFVPKRAVWICAWFLLGASSIAAIYFGDVLRSKYLQTSIGVPAPVLGMGYATVASWWSSVCLLSCSLLAMMIYTIRCHRVDDYRGRYRQWAVVSLLCLMASVALAAPVHETFESLAVQLTHGKLSSRPALWWLIPSSLVACITGLRALLDMRPSKAGPVFLVLATVGYIITALGHLGVVRFPQIETIGWLPVTLLASHYCLFWSLCLFARYVYLDAQGQLSIRPRKKARQAVRNKAAAETDVIQIDEGRRRKPKADKRKQKEDPAKTSGTDDEPQDADMSLAEMELLTNPDLTRAERRKLRKQMKRDRRAA